MGSGVGGIIFHLKDKAFQFPEDLYCNVLHKLQGATHTSLSFFHHLLHYSEHT